MDADTHSTSEKHQEEPSKPSTWSSGWRSWLSFGIIATTLYFGNVELQTYLGKQALEQVKFPALTLKQAFDKASRENKLVLADMSAIWCPSCRKLDAEVLSHPKVNQAINRDYVFVRIEYESAAGKAFQKRYNVHAFPTLLVLNPKGEKLRNLGLTFNKEEFLRRL